ncbi:MAG: L,D-transpeptidase [Patescibacteria group bacterium]
MLPRLIWIGVIGAVALASFPTGTAYASHQSLLTIQILHEDGSIQSSFDVPTANRAGGVKVAVGDLGKDGVPEIVIGNGLGNEPRVTVYRADGSVIGGFLAYDQTMGLGINVAICDIDGDGTNDIVTGTQFGAGPQVRTFDHMGVLKHNGFFAYDEAFRGGVHISCGDLDNDGRAELVTSPGPTGGPHVRIWEFNDEQWELQDDFFAFAEDETGGVVTTIHDSKLYATLQKTSGHHVIKSYVIHRGVEEQTTQENHTTTTSSLFVLRNHIIATATEGGHIANDIVNLAVDVPFGSVNATAADIDSDGDDEIIVSPDRALFSSFTDAKRIVVDISEQQLYAYENGLLANTFAISSGKYPWATPVGNTSVLAKLPYVDYTWYYGPGDPRNYSLGLVPWNLRIYNHIYIHYAYWHNNFGHPMSHGCVNVNLDNIKWIYNFADVGTPVDVRE